MGLDGLGSTCASVAGGSHSGLPGTRYPTDHLLFRGAGWTARGIRGAPTHARSGNSYIPDSLEIATASLSHDPQLRRDRIVWREVGAQGMGRTIISFEC